LFVQARIFIWRIYGLDNLKLASIISNQAFIYENQGCLSEAESLYVKALAMKKKWLGPDHPSLVINLSNLAIFYYLQGRLSDADPLMDECLANLAFQFNRLFPYYSEKNKDDYLNVFSETFSKYYSYAYRAYPTDPRISGKMLNLSLWRKGMIVSSQSAVIRRISSLADTSATAILQQFRSTREELVKLCLSQTDTSIAGRKRQTVLEQESEALERRLSLISSQSIHSPRIDSIKWQDIAAALKPNQAAIDFLAFRLYNQHWTDTIFYCALIVTHAGRQPVLVMLGTESQLNHLLNFEYKSMIHQQTYHRFDQPGRLYEMIWKPLEPYLKGINKIYLSPDGMLNSVSFGILVDQQGKMLIDDFEIHYMSNLSDLVKVNHRENGFPNRDWVLIGNPTFKADETEIRGIWSAEALPADSTRQSSRLDNLTRTHLSELPWTQTEIDSICSLLQADHQPVTVFTKLKATEENLKGILAPKVLHIATHGFFMPAAERVDSLPDGGNEGDHDMFRNNPLLRSGLYLAGASNRLSERGLNDGILFAHEAVDLDLQATELVVLSACETGVGEVRTGEGVYGLRRAFQIAGAQSVMMSLWPVPDQETQELMTRFYRKLLQHANPYSALREAQQEQRRIVRERYRKEVPFYWGAFIMVGGPSGE
nr:CHAT domain-containing protein [Candidatus Delongbacteria bacterium]